MQISTLVLLIIILTLPVITIYKKFDILRKFLFGSAEGKATCLPKLNVSFSILSKSLVYVLLAAKLYFSLYMLFYLATNNLLVSAFLGLIGLGLIIIIIYVFANIKPHFQNFIIYISGCAVTTILFALISFITAIFFFYSIKNLNFESIRLASSLIGKDLILAFITTIVSYFSAKNVSNYILSLQGKSHHLFNKIFYFIGRIPSVILGFMSYLIINKLNPSFFSNSDNIISKIIFCSILQGILYSSIIVSRVINYKDSTPTKIIDSYSGKFSFIGSFMQIFFEMNLFVQFLFFSKNTRNFFTNNYSYEIAMNPNLIYPICFLCFIIYSVYFFMKKRFRIKNEF